MEHVCLAAGRGERLGRLGSYLQKCMYPVGLRPFLEHTLVQWREGAVVDPAGDRLTLVVGHLAEQVRTYFGSAFEGVRIRYVTQHEPLGTGHALALAAAGLPDGAPAVAWLADLFAPASAFARVVQHPREAVVTLGPGSAGESPRLRATRDGERVVRVWDGVEPRYDVGLWKLPVPVMRDLRRVPAEKGEFRVLPNLQVHVDAGLEVGWVEVQEWVHLGGTVPSSERNVRNVVERVLAAAP
jgi:CTP:molybdopterin cytidylyltransferase MocA